MKVSKETLERLRRHGKMGDSLEDVVNRLLDELEKIDNAGPEIEKGEKNSA